jgi:hypothetical protein
VTLAADQRVIDQKNIHQLLCPSAAEGPGVDYRGLVLGHGALVSTFWQSEDPNAARDSVGASAISRSEKWNAAMNIRLLVCFDDLAIGRGKNPCHFKLAIIAQVTAIESGAAENLRALLRPRLSQP